MEVLLFAGTTEGRELAEWLSARGRCEVVACVATGYGAAALARLPRVSVSVGALPEERKRQLLRDHDFACVVDATHPYAEHISASVAELGRACGVDVVRVLRKDLREGREPAGQDGLVRCTDAGAAAAFLATTSGNVLLTTGTRDLATYVAAMPDYEGRLYVRVLPASASLAAVEALGVPARHVVAMQGPFSERLNRALMEECHISWLVTKRSGAAGGFGQKMRAARACGAGVVVVEPPPQGGGVSLDEAKRLLEDRYGA